MPHSRILRRLRHSMPPKRTAIHLNTKLSYAVQKFKIMGVIMNILKAIVIFIHITFHVLSLMTSRLSGPYHVPHGERGNDRGR